MNSQRSSPLAIDTMRWTKLPFDLAICLLALVAAHGLAARGIPFQLSQGTPDLSEYLRVLPVYLILFLFSALVFRLYRPRKIGSALPLAADVLKINLQTALLGLAVLFYYREFSFSRLILTLFVSLNLIAIFLHHLGWQWWEQQLASRGIGTRRCLVVGHGKLAQAIDQRLSEHPWTGLQAVGFLRVDDEEPQEVPEERILGSISDLDRIAAQHGVQEVIVAVPFRHMEVLVDLDERLSQSTLGLQWVPDLQALNTLHREITAVEDMHLMNLRASPLRGVSRLIKRTLDISVSLLLLIIFSPLFVAIALLVWWTSGAPVLFRQERVGRDDRVFRLVKFRTMRVDAEQDSGPVFAKPDDQRVTGLGRFLRHSSLDELPQLWNVLRGHMSLVGPRPERPVFIEEFARTVPRYMMRHHAKAGLTGWAQVNGLRGNTSLEQRIQYDLYYLKNWSLGLDLKILFLTLFRAWRRKWNSG